MAIVKLIASLVLGGGLGYGLLVIATPDNSEIVKNLPPYSAQKQDLFKRYKEKTEGFMNIRPNISSQESRTRNSANVVEK